MNYKNVPYSNANVKCLKYDELTHFIFASSPPLKYILIHFDFDTSSNSLFENSTYIEFVYILLFVKWEFILNYCGNVSI